MPRTLLLADDSITIQKVVGITFANEDFQIVSVDNGEDAVNRAGEVKPDIILADIVMPKLDGYQVCERVKGNAALRHIPVLLLTGAFKVFDEARAKQVGADGYIAKPFDSQALIDKVKELITRATQQPRAAAPAVAAAPVAPTPVAAAPVASPPVMAAPPPAPPPPAPAMTMPSDFGDPFATPTEKRTVPSAPPPVMAAPSPAPSPAPPPFSMPMPSAPPAAPMPASPMSAPISTPNPFAFDEVTQPFQKEEAPSPMELSMFEGIPGAAPAPLSMQPPAGDVPANIWEVAPPAPAPAVSNPFNAAPVAPATAVPTPLPVSPAPMEVFETFAPSVPTPVVTPEETEWEAPAPLESLSGFSPPPIPHDAEEAAPMFEAPMPVPGAAVSAPPPAWSAPEPIAPVAPVSTPAPIPAEIPVTTTKPSSPMAESGEEFSALKGMTREVIERIAWEIIPDLAEAIIREEIDRLKKEKGIFS